MYLQITTKCNMTCAHCCYSCNKNGKHGDYSLLRDAINFAWERDSGSLSIGGGEPTMHPEFFNILRYSLRMDYEFVWMATNGSKTKTMFRLDSIMQDCDYENFEYAEDDYYNNMGIISVERDKFAVALSQDSWHAPIDRRVVDLWKRRKYEIRNVGLNREGVTNVGRAKRSGVGRHMDSCVCSDVMILPTGKIKMCGCPDSPIVGDIWAGIESKWEDFMQEDSFRDTNCFNGR